MKRSFDTFPGIIDYERNCINLTDNRIKKYWWISFYRISNFVEINSSLPPFESIFHPSSFFFFFILIKPNYYTVPYKFILDIQKMKYNLFKKNNYSFFFISLKKNIYIYILPLTLSIKPYHQNGNAKQVSQLNATKSRSNGGTRIRDTSRE